MKKIFFLIIVLNVISCNKKEISKETKMLIKPYESYKYFFALDRKKEDFEIIKLNKVASEQELYQLALNGKNPYIKGISIRAIIQKDDDEIFEIFEKSLFSKDSIISRTHCLSSTHSIPAFIFENICFKNGGINSPKFKVNCPRFYKIIFKQDSLNIKLLEELSFWIPKNNDYYDKIREIVINQKSVPILPALARFRRKQDIDLIKSFGAEAFEAIEEFPSDKFLPLFTKHIDEYKSYQYKFALKKYPSYKTTHIRQKIKLLEQTEKN